MANAGGVELVHKMLQQLDAAKQSLGDLAITHLGGLLAKH